MGGSDFSELRTPRLSLRRLLRADLAAVCAYRSLPEVARYQSWETFGADDAERLLVKQDGLEPNVPGTWFQLAIVEASSGIVIGDCGLHFLRDDHRQMEIGITLAPKFQGRGYASETLRAVLEYAFGTLQKHRMTACTDADNLPAAALLRRVGFRQEAHFVENDWFKGRWGSEFLFAMLRSEWEAGGD